ncbi:MAG: Protein of unknown function (DUF1587)/Protein of unknown function (DUF1592)/Protein of unknown [Verrucomicrobiales bacterium]|nr:Protein of unknown function (DUF1587)/Protein of unknown function (DUF1592)/Protein of unknown [Verrucomicrobiales bacterium]
MSARLFAIFILILLVRNTSFGANPAPTQRGASKYEKQIKPLLSRYCYGCHNDKKHKGDLSLESFADIAAILKEPKRWELVMHHVQTREMPPEDKPQPSDAERHLLVSWIQKEVFQCDCDKPDPGRVTVRRLNRAEYNNTIRDLVGVDFNPAEDFPADDSGYGFDNIGDSLSLSPILLEKYFKAAQKILDTAILKQPDTNGPVRRFQAERFSRSNNQARDQKNGIMGLFREVTIFTNMTIAVEGDYTIRTRAYGEQAGPELPKMDVSLNDKSIAVFKVSALQEEPSIYRTRLHLQPGEYKISVAYLNNFRDPKEEPGKNDRNLYVDFVDVVGPAGPPQYPESHLRIFPKPITAQTDKRAYAGEIIGRFVDQAYRRPATKDEIKRLLQFYSLGMKNGEHFEGSVQLALQAVLVSPGFLFRGEFQPQPNDSSEIHRIDDFALASRLSYFLWSSMPDKKLFAEAKNHTLQKNLVSEVERMLKDPKADALSENFCGQWLQLRHLRQAAPDSDEFPSFDESLRVAMEDETQLFFASILKEDRSVLDFLAADYTFLNQRLASHYQIKGVTGENFQRVHLEGSERGGLLSQASILTLTSNPNRTSPVKRGKWILENLLGTAPPPPPPDIPPLDDKKGPTVSTSLRQRLEEHRKNPACASCHARMDPIGFALENFDAIGSWRTMDGKFPVDASGEFATGEKIDGVGALRKFLLEKRRDEFVRCLAEKMLTYALGRGLEVYDRCAVDEIVARMARNEFRFSSLILAITESQPFQFRRGEKFSTTDYGAANSK